MLQGKENLYGTNYKISFPTLNVLDNIVNGGIGCTAQHTKNNILSFSICSRIHIYIIYVKRVYEDDDDTRVR